MTPINKHLLLAYYNWILENQLTPFVICKPDEDTIVPMEHVNDGIIVLNLLPSAINDLTIEDDYVAFDARFSGRTMEIFLPMHTVVAVRTKEDPSIILQFPPMEKVKQKTNDEDTKTSEPAKKENPFTVIKG